MKHELPVVPSFSVAADQHGAETIRAALLLGLDAIGELQRLQAAGIPVQDPDPDRHGVSLFVAALGKVL